MKPALRALFGSAIVVAIGVFAACVGDSAPSVTSDDSGAPSGSDAGNSTVDGNAAMNNDAGNVVTDAGIDSGPSHFCTTLSPPDGAADYMCADFDESPFGQGFKDAAVEEAGALAPNTLAAASLPTSLLATIGPNDGSQFLQDAYFWTQAGANQLTSINLTIAMNPFPAGTGIPPKYSGIIYLASIYTTSGEIDFAYSSGHVYGTDPAYFGYIVRVYHKGLTIIDNPIEVPALPQNIWTDVSLTYDLINGTIALSYAGAVQLAATPAFAATETLASTTVGPASDNDNSPLYNFRYDNVRIFTTRTQ